MDAFTNGMTICVIAISCMFLPESIAWVVDKLRRPPCPSEFGSDPVDNVFDN